eukprot:scaffold22726_cov42-Phaeocystis_antarctica.AAC.2
MLGRDLGFWRDRRTKRGCGCRCCAGSAAGVPGAPLSFAGGMRPAPASAASDARQGRRGLCHCRRTRPLLCQQQLLHVLDLLVIRGQLLVH